MKKRRIILPVFMATVSMPLISLVGCGPEPQPVPIVEPEFSQDGFGGMPDTKIAHISIKWNFIDDEMEFSNMCFMYNGGIDVTNKVECPADQPSYPCQFIIKFDDEITQNIEDGVLFFNYEDKTTGVKGSSSVKDIHINQFTPITPTFTVKDCDVISDTKATLTLNWEPSVDIIKFNNDFSFTYNAGASSAKSVTYSNNKVTIEFNNTLENEITDGKLTFTYKDETLIYEGQGIVENINIPKWTGQINFRTCGWAQVAEACANLENGTWTDTEFCERFRFDDQIPTSLNDFVGQVKDVTLNGQPHHVKIVGVKEDFTTEDRTKFAALTFQFDNLISRSSDGTYLKIKWQAPVSGESKAYNRDYWNSTLNSALNNNSSEETIWDNDESEKQSVFEMIQEGDPDLARAIKSVWRGVNVHNGSTIDVPFEKVQQKTRLFCPTLSNFFSDTGILNSTIYNAGEGQKAKYSAEGQPHDVGVLAQYSYYQSLIGNTAFSTGEIGSRAWNVFDCLKLKDSANYAKGPSEPGSWWYFTSSPNIYKTFSEWSWCVRDDSKAAGNSGKIGDEKEHAVYNSGAIAPCFCI